MERAIEFFGNHLVLATLWIAVAVALILYQKSKAVQSLSSQETTMLVNRSKGVILDIREKQEFEKGHIVDAINIPLAKLKESLIDLKKIKKDNPIIVVCQLGHKSEEAVKILHEDEFTQVSKMSGGINEWNAQSLPLVQKKK